MAAARFALPRSRTAAAALVIVALVATMLGVRPVAAAPGDLTVSDPTVIEGNSGTVTARFTITAAAGTFASISYTTRDGSAVAGEDYTTTTGTHTFLGSGTHDVDVPVKGDTIPEPNETFFLDVTVTAGVASCLDCPGTGTITNDEGTAAPTLAIGNDTAAESEANATFTVTRSGDASGPVSVDYATQDGTAKAGADYTARTGTVAFAAGETSKSIDVPILQDTLDEAAETFTVVLSNEHNATISDASGLGTITDDDATPALSISDVTVAEGNSGTTNAVFTVTLTPTSGQAVQVDYTTQNGTATAPADYATRAATLVFAAGENSRTISVPVIGDTVDEANETFTVQLSGAVNASISDATGIGTITDDETDPTLSIDDVPNVNEGNSGTTNATFTVTLTGNTARTVTVAYTTQDGTAKAGEDYTAKSGTLTFEPGDTSEPITVLVTGDTLDEADETFTVKLSAPTVATLADDTGTATISDNDNPPTISVAGPAPVLENAAPATFVVSLSSASGQSVTVNYATTDGTATAGVDYAPVSGTLTFDPGQTSKNVQVNIIEDTIAEGSETFDLELSAPSNASLSNDDTATATILDDGDPGPAFTISDVQVTEGTNPTATFTVTLSSASGQPTTVTATTAAGSAKAGEDYVHTTDVLEFAPGDLSEDFVVTILNDAIPEGTETFVVNLTAATGGATIADGQGVGTILNDDGPPPSLTIADASVSEGNTDLTFTVTRSGSITGTLTVDYATANGTAVAPGDYTSRQGTLTFSPGELSETITVPILEDTVHEGDETFTVTLSNPTNAVLGSPSTATGTITNDDAVPSISVNSPTSAEGTGGTSTLTFRVSLSGASSGTVTVDYATGGGTATANTDYTPATGTLTFEPGQTFKDIPVTIVADSMDEADETVQLTVSNAGGTGTATIGTPTGTGTITDDDAQPTTSIADATVTEGNSGTVNAVFTVSLSAASGRTVTMNFATADGTATQPADYASTSGSLSFAPGETTKSIEVPVAGELLDETDETFTVTLSAPVNTTFSDGTATGTIVDDDPMVSIGDVTVTEGASGTVNADFPVTLTVASDKTVTVTATTSVGTAGTSDFTTKSATVTFVPGDTSETFTVLVQGDTIDESNETFTVVLSAPTNAVIGDGSGTGTIIDDDGAPTVRIDGTSVTEGNTGTATATFTVSLSNPSASTVTVVGSTSSVTAGSPSDYTAKAATVTFEPGDVSEPFTVSVAGDTLDEPNESFTVTLSSPTNSSIATGGGTATGTIVDDDPTPTLSIGDASTTEGNAGTTALTFTVTLSAPSGQPVTAGFVTGSGTATDGVDYASTSGTIAINPGATTTTITVNVAGDTVDEADETFTVSLSNPTNATIADGSGSGTIVDDDVVAPQGYSLVGEDGSLYTFGTAKNLGDMRGQRLNAPIIGVAYTPGGNGYWLVARDGGIFSFGDAEFLGSMGNQRLNAPVIGMAATPTGKGYWLFASDGGIFTFGDARFFGSMGDQKLNAPVINMEPLASGGGYWLVAADGGIFTFGSGDFYGSMGDQRLNQPVFDMTSTDSDDGYWLVARDGGIFSFGDAAAKFFGSAVNETPRPTRVIGMDATPDSQGYWIADASGKVYRFGNAQDLGDRFGQPNPAPMVAFATVPTA